MKLIKFTAFLLMATILLNSCSKEYSVENGGLQAPTGNWEFTNGAINYYGNMDSASIDSSGATKQLRLNGTSANGESFKMVLYSSTAFKTGQYKASLFQSTFNYSVPGKTIYEASQLIGEFIVNITSITDALVTGTFSGSVKDSTGAVKQLTLGKFKTSLGDGLSGSPSSGVLGDSSGNCKPVVLSGIYTQGVAATAANIARVQVVVAVPGSYTISTNTVGGFSFSGSGVFASKGTQDVILTASGNSELAGEQLFTLHYGNSQCTFKVNFLQGAGPSNDYFPLKVNTNWTMSLQGGSASENIFLKVVDSTIKIGSNIYCALAQGVSASSPVEDSSYVRKLNGEYYEYTDFAELYGFDQPVKQEFLFLKDNVAVGTSWNSAAINGTIASVAFAGYMKMTILAKAVPVTIGSFDFTDVIKVKYELFMNGVPVAVQSGERWFAKNVGPIYTSQTDGTQSIIFQVSDYHIF